MKIVITGGNGYIGARLSLYLANAGNQVIPVCFPKIPDDENWTTKMYDILEGNIRQVETINKIASFNPDVVIHLVSLDHFESEKEPGFVNDVNVLPTWRLLDICTKQQLKKFIYFSTIHVYGKLENDIIEENHTVNEGNAYGLTHRLSENICEYFNRKTSTDIVTVRLSNSYGAPVFLDNNCWWLVINDLCKNAYLEKKITLLSDGSPQRDFIHGNDVCQAIKKIIEHDNKVSSENIYHISSGITLTILEIAKMVREVYQSRYSIKLPIITSQKVVSDDDTFITTPRYTIDNKKIKHIGFSQTIDIQTGINDLFDYLEKNY